MDHPGSHGIGGKQTHQSLSGGEERGGRAVSMARVFLYKDEL